MFERFTSEARDVAVGAQTQARERGDAAIRPEHLLLALLAQADSSAQRVLAQLGADPVALRDAARPTRPPDSPDPEALATIGVDLDAVRRAVEAAFGPGALDRPSPAGRCRGHIPFTPDAKKTLELALREALALGDRHIGSEHVLLGLLRTEPRLGIGLPAARSAVRDVRRGPGDDPAPAGAPRR